MAAIPGLGGGLATQDPNNTGGIVPGKTFKCSDEMKASAILLTSLGSLGIAANILLMVTICCRRSFNSWSYGLLFHQGLVDLARSAILIPLGHSISSCRAMTKCSLVETTFLLLVTVSTVNLLSVVLNAAPITPEDDEDIINLMKDSPQCMTFVLFMIWFASVTVNLGPTFLSGALAANAGTVMDEPSCPLVQGPYRHYVLNVIWIFINSLSILLTIYHLHRLYKDYTRNTGLAPPQATADSVMVNKLYNADTDIETQELVELSPSKIVQMQTYMLEFEEEGIKHVKMFVIITLAYIIFWGPLFLVTLINISLDWKDAKSSVSHEVSLHVSFVHAIINPLLFLLLNKQLRSALINMLCCNKRLSLTDRYNGLNRKRKGPFNQESQGACPGAATNGISTVNGNNSSESQVLALPKNGNNNTNNILNGFVFRNRKETAI